MEYQIAPPPAPLVDAPSPAPGYGGGYVPTTPQPSWAPSLPQAPIEHPQPGPSRPATPEPEPQPAYASAELAHEPESYEPVAEPVEQAEPTRPGQAHGKRAASRNSERTLARRAASLALRIASASEPDRVRAAAVLSLHATASAADIAAVAVTSLARDVQPATDLMTIIDSPPMEAAVNAAALGRPRLRPVWRLAHVLGAVAEELPASDPKAALALIRGIDTAGVNEVRGDLANALELIGR